MSLDPSIYFRNQNRLTVGQRFEQGQQRAEQREAAEQTRAHNALVMQEKSETLREAALARQVFAEFNGQYSPEMLSRLRQVSPKLALDVEGKLATHNKTQADAWKVNLDNQRTEADMGVSLINAAIAGGPDVYGVLRSTIAERLPDLAGALPEEHDGQRLNALLQYGRTGKEALDAQERVVLAFAKGDMRYVAGVFANSSPEQQETLYTGMIEAGVPQATLDALLANPEAASMTEAERQTAANQDADNERMRLSAEETARHNRATEGIARGNLSVAQRNAASNETRARAAAQTAAAGSATTSAGDLTPEYATALDRAIMNIPAVRRPAIVNLANRLAKDGDIEQLKEVIRQAAIETENVDDKRQITGRFNAAAAVRDIRAGLRELQAEGVDTNILRGTVEDVARRLGTSTNPKLVTISTRVLDAYVEYRRSLTGVAFSVRESADYEKLFPNYRNTLPVNEAILTGLERGFATRDREYWTRVLGAKGAQLVGAIPSEAAAAPSGGAPAGPGISYQDYLNRRRGGT